MISYTKFKAFHSDVLRRLVGRKPIGWHYWKYYQGFLNRLYKRRPNTLKNNDSIGNSFDSDRLFADIKAVVKLSSENQFTLDAHTLNYLWQKLLIYKPKTILEFGSGVSTNLFLQYFNLYTKGGTLISIDQDGDYLLKSGEDINAGSVKHVKLLAAIDNNGYVFDASARALLEGYQRSIDFVLIDGPYGDWMVRYNTLPLIEEHCKKGCPWFLDDAFRDSEMEILRAWRKRPSISVDGIIDFGKGLATGKVK